MTVRVNVDSRAALTVQHLDIRSMDGIYDPYCIDDLCPGINLVHGQNGIGKSRSATALQWLLWPGTSSRRTEIYGNLLHSNEDWRVHIDGPIVRYHRNGLPVPNAPGFADIPVTHRDRYLLTLHDLLRADNRDLALEIQREVAGGYDLAAARDVMAIKPGGKRQQPTKWKNAHHHAAAEASRLQQHHQGLLRKERALRQTREELRAAIDATRQLTLLEAARDHIMAKEELHSAVLARESFPDPIGSMDGSEYEHIRHLKSEMDACMQQRALLDQEIAQNLRALEVTGFADSLPPEPLLTELRNRLARLHSHEDACRQALREVARERAHLDALRGRISRGLGSVSELQLEALDTSGLNQLSRLTREIHEAGNALHVQEQLHEWLGGVETPPDPDPFRQGLDLLYQYAAMAEARPGGKEITLVQRILLVAAAVIVVEAILLAIVVSPFFLILMLVSVPIIWVALRQSRSPSAVRLLAVQQQYLLLGLAQPSNWTQETVQETRKELQELLAKALLDREKHSRWSNLEERCRRTDEALRNLADEREAMVARFGVVADATDPESLRHIAADIDRWRQANDAHAQAKACAEDAASRASGEFAGINQLLRRYGDLETVESAGAAAAIEHLGERVNLARQLGATLGHLRTRRNEQVLPSIRKHEGAIENVFQRLGIAHDDELSLREMCDRVKPCREAQRALEAADIILRRTRDRLDSVPEYAEMERDQVEQAWAEANAFAARREEIQGRISSIEAEIRHAKQGSVLEVAVAREEDALNDLRESQDRDYRNAAGWNVFDFIQGRNRDINEPAVFSTADEYFSLFTAGTYRLRLDGGVPEFSAEETSTRRLLQLDELSSGTRVQMLLAVRLAFIETMEQGPQFPIILDETLGNTDDLRATAIISAVTDIARRGRQVIYFTAQHDEISKWNTCLNGSGVVPPSKTFDLGHIRGRVDEAVLSSFTWDPTMFMPISIPDGVDYNSLRDLLGVPPVDFWAKHIGAVDLWYLIPDVLVLTKLRSRGIKQWGQYETLHEMRRLEGIWTPEVHDRALARALVIETVSQLWRHGRSKPVTKDCLRESDLITPAFRDRVAECAQKHSWNGRALISALRRSEVSRFKANITDELEEYLRAQGCISEQEPWPNAVIRAGVLSAADASISRGVICEHEIDALLTSLTSAAEWPQ